MAKTTEKRKAYTVQIRPSLHRALKLTSATAGDTFSECLDKAILSFIPPVFQKGIGKGAK